MNTESLPAGSFGPFGENEVLLASAKDDPPKFRQESPGPGRSLGCFSFGRNGNERVLVQGKLSEDGTQGEFSLWVWDESRGGSDDDKMGEPVLTVTPAGIFVHGRPLSGSTPTGRFYSGNGLYCWNYQDDGSVVLYATQGSHDETVWVPQWAQRPNGRIESFV